MRLRAFYESVFGGTAGGDEVHSTLTVGGTYFVFMLQKTEAFYYTFEKSGSNVIVGFNVDNVDTEYKRLLALDVQMLNEPTTHPWGARSFQFKDIDGNILNFRSFSKE